MCKIYDELLDLGKKDVVMEDDKYLGRFFMHFFDESGDQAELGVTMIINSLQWRKTMDVKGI